MIILNFSHPLTAEQLGQIEELTSQKVERVIPIPVQFDNNLPYVPQLDALMHSLPLLAEEMQTSPLLVNPPALNFIAVLVLAELHGRMGYFPPILRLRPLPESIPQRYEVVEILNLHAVRDTARQKRHQNGAETTK